MKIIKKLAVIVLMSVYCIGMAQNTDQVRKKGPADSYARSSISYLLLDFSNEKYAPILKQAINTTKLPSKFDSNNLKKKYVEAPYAHVETEAFPNWNANAKQVLSVLTAEKYATDIVKFWWKITDDGSYSTKLIQERGEYNATDIDYNQAMATKVGRAKIGDQGLKLIGNSYVLVLDYHNIKTMEEIYDEQDRVEREKAKKNKTEFKPVKRIKNGFTGKVTTYLFQVNYPDTVQGYFDQAFIDEKKLDLTKLDKIFDQVYSPFKLITTDNQPAEGTQPNPGEFLAPAVQQTPDQLMVALVNNGITKSLDRIESKVEAFRVKTPVTNVRPIRAKIGKKESLTHERRYFVWEYVGDANNNVKARKQGVIRAKKVIDNRNDELGSTKESSFYQIGGGKVREGMTLQEAKDFGIGLSAGFGSADRFVMSLDMNICQYLDVPVKQLKFYVDFGTGTLSLEPTIAGLNTTALNHFPTSTSDFKSTKWSLGIVKEYPFMRNFLFGWHLGWGGETLTYDDNGGKDNKEKLMSSGFQLGARIGMNLFSPSFQVIGSVNYRGNGTVTYKYTPTGGSEQSESLDPSQKWSDLFSNKSPVSINLSLRLNF